MPEIVVHFREQLGGDLYELAYTPSTFGEYDDWEDYIPKDSVYLDYSYEWTSRRKLRIIRYEFEYVADEYWVGGVEHRRVMARQVTEKVFNKEFDVRVVDGEYPDAQVLTETWPTSL